MKQSASPAIDLIGCEAAGTIPGLFLRRVEHSPNDVAYSEFDRGIWQDLTWREMLGVVTNYRAALDKAGMARGDRVAILLPNCIDWIAFDIAAMANGLITVPLYLHDSAAHIRFILSNSGARLCLTDRARSLNLLNAEADIGNALKEVWLRGGCDRLEPGGNIDLYSLSDVLDAAEGDPGPERCTAQDIATLIHTSGTTGQPKGVMLSHHALLWNAEAVAENVPPLKDDIFLSLLPLAHAFERTMSYHLAMMGGSRVVFGRAIEMLRQDVLEVRPTILIAVPRLYERFYEAITSEGADNPIKRWLVQKAAAIGWLRFEARRGKGSAIRPIVRLLCWPLLERFIARPVLQAFGGRLRVAVSGGAPLSNEVSHFLIGLGLPLVEGYGLTEAAPVITGTKMEDNVPGSVGKPLRGIETRFSSDGELLVRSPALMNGYWNDPVQSEAAIDEEGWLHTGDIAEFREDHLYITGRAKDLIVLSTGKKVVAAGVEAAIEADPLFEQSCALGNGRASVVAVLTLNRDQWASFAERNNLDMDLPNAPDASLAILERISKAMRDLPSYAQVRAVHAQLEPWTVEDGSLTPTLKIKRHVIEKRYRHEIEELDPKKLVNKGTKFKPGAGGRCTVLPADLSELDRAELTRQLYEVNKKIFSGVSVEEFRRHVVDASAEYTIIELYFNTDGQIKGYCACHRFRRQVKGQNVIVLRAEAGLLPECRGFSKTYHFRMIRAISEMLKHPFTPIYYLGTLVHASSYHLICKNFPKVYPHPDYETPTYIQDIARELIDTFPSPPVTETDPFVRDVGWVTIETPLERRLGQRSDQRHVRFFKARNPGYAEGHGLVVIVPITIDNISAAFLSHLRELALTALVRQ